VVTLTQLKLQSLERIREARLSFDAAQSDHERNEALANYDRAISHFRHLASLKDNSPEGQAATHDLSVYKS